MRGRSIGFIILNIIVSAVVALGLIQVLPSGGSSTTIQVATVSVLVTTTPDPEGDATRIALAVDGTVQSQIAEFEATNNPQSVLPDGLLDTPEAGAAGAAAQAGVGDAAAQNAASDLPDGCILHTIAEGDTPFGIAEEYEVSGASVMIANQLTDTDAVALQIGDQLIVPLPNCDLTQIIPATETPAPTVDEVATEEATEEIAEETTEEATEETAQEPTEEVTEEITSTPTLSPTPAPTETPTPTLTATPFVAPTSPSAQIEIVEIISPGDITAEGVTILNRGSVVDITGWVLADAQGNEFIFPEQRLFTNGSITVYTRAGENTPIVFYWGRSGAVWGEEGDVATLTDAGGRVQSSVRIGGQPE
ncbi:MAG: lamin tail domain-containing protein [Chloroflexota bacterium]